MLITSCTPALTSVTSLPQIYPFGIQHIPVRRHRAPLRCRRMVCMMSAVRRTVRGVAFGEYRRFCNVMCAHIAS